MEIDFDLARWGWHPERKEHEAGYTLFRKTVVCEKPEPYHLLISADNRFTFFLDGKLLGRGPVRGDLDHYHYDEYSGTLSAGKHVFAAEVIVWQEAWHESAAPWAEIHAGGGFMAAGFAGTERMELPEGWLCSIDRGRRILPWSEAWDRKGEMAAPPMDEINFHFYDKDWTTAENPAGVWVPPVLIGRAEFVKGHQNDPKTPWHLRERPLKQLVESASPIINILEGPDTLRLEDGHLKGTLPAGQSSVLVELKRNQTSMVYFSGSNGKGKCRIAYSETLFDYKGMKLHSYPGKLKGLGYGDKLILDGMPWQYRSFWYRTGKYVELTLDLEEKAENVDLELRFWSYPMGPFAEFHAPDDPVLEEIYRTACHTLLCCAHEGFEDCPGYEQLQYAGDSRIEALVSYAVSGNDDMGRYALRMLAASQLPNGFTQSRYPSFFKQVILGYSLIWALMVHDHYRIFHDPELVRELLPQMEVMLNAFERARLDNGLIGSIHGWHYTDWVIGWPSGCSDREQDEPETILNLFYAEACRCTAELENETGKDGSDLLRRSQKTLDAVNQLCFDAVRNRYVDCPGHADYLSLHANVLAVLFGAVPEAERAAFLREVCKDAELKPMSLYFSFYLLQAISIYGTDEELRRHYAPWEQMLERGCTTFPEHGEVWSRSDCHAWSCAPAWFLLKKGKNLL